MCWSFSHVRLCNHMDCSPPGSSVHGILQARVLEWVAMPSSRGSPNPGIKPGSPSFQADALTSEPPGKPIFCPTSFQREWAAFLGAWCPLPSFRSCFVEFAQRSNDLSMNLWGREWSPHSIPPPSYDHSLQS